MSTDKYATDFLKRMVALSQECERLKGLTNEELVREWARTEPVPFELQSEMASRLCPGWENTL